MNWTVISEGIISTVVGGLISTLIVFLTKNIFYKKTEKLTDGEQSIKIPFLKDVFLISLFITSFVIVLTFFSFVYNWQVPNGAYLLFASVGMCAVTAWTYNNQCPKCRAVFHGKKLMSKDTLREEKRPYHHRHEIRYLYTDDTIKDRNFVGPEKVKMETWRIEKENYACDSCKHIWSKTFERNLDEPNRPKPEIHRTNFINPEGTY